MYERSCTQVNSCTKDLYVFISMCNSMYVYICVYGVRLYMCVHECMYIFVSVCMREYSRVYVHICFVAKSL